jgi:hypothetical protein
MALVVNDRVQQTGTANTTVSFTLSGSVTGYQSFSVIGNGNTTFYGATDATGSWEVGIGTYATGGTLTRTTILASSNSGSAVTFSGTVVVFVTYPAEKSISYDANGIATIGSTLGYSDTGIIGSFASTVAGYNQVILQNKSNATNASSNFNVSNDAATATTGYAEFGINSSTYSGTGAFNIAGASYLASASTDLAIGTYGAYNVHFVTNSNTTDAMTIYNSGGVSLGGQPDPGLGTLYANNVYLGFTTITAAAGTTVLTNSSSGWQQVVGTTTQTIQLPNATTLYKGLAYTVANNSTGNVTIKDNAGTTIDTVVTGGTSVLVLTANGTSAGSWSAYSYIPSSYDFSTSTANFGTATITNATYNGNTITPAYGGTGLTTFAAANNALYSTSSSALAAGTLPIAAGGTGNTTNTLNGVVYGNGTSALGVTAAGTTGQVLVATTSAAPSWSNISSLAITSVSGTTNQITASTTTGAVTLSLPTSITTGQHIANQSISGSVTQGAFAYGTLNGSDTGIFASYQTSIASYAYMALQNTSSNAAATTDIALYNDTASLGKYIDIGINSSGFTGTGNFSLANAGYIYTNGGDLALGTYTANGIHFIVNNGATDAMTISSTGVVSLGTALAVGSGGTGIATAPTAGSVVYGASTTAQGYTAAGTSGQVLISGGAGSPTWSTNIGGNAANVTGTVAVANGGTGSTSLTANNVLLGNGTSALQVVAPGTSGNVLTSNGTTWISAASTGGGATITGTTSAGTYYVVGTTSTLGTLSTASISNTNVVSYNASTGALSAVSHVSSSDERLKTDWANLSVDFIDRLADVKHGTFERISSGNREAGVTAQSLKEVLPEAVVEDEEGYMSVNYGAAALVAAIELAKEVKALRAEIKELKAVSNPKA